MGSIRLLLAISVIIAHSGPVFGLRMLGSQVAVQSFYIISGFYMSLILNEKYIGKNNSYKLFITNRFLRIYPVYWTVFLLVILYCITLGAYSNGTHWSYFGTYKTYLSAMNPESFLILAAANILIFFQDALMFLGIDTGTGNLFFTTNFQNTDPALYRFLFIPQAWTIAIELMFYLIAPFIVRRKIKFIVLLIFCSLALRFLLYLNGLDHDPWTYRFFPTELVFFLLGNLSYRIYTRIRSLEFKAIYNQMLFCIFLGLIVTYSLIYFEGIMYLYFFFFILALPFIFLLSKKWKTDSYLGELSYPVYISHLFVLTLVNLFKVPSPAGIGLTLIISSIVFSILLNELVSKKIELYRQKRLNQN